MPIPELPGQPVPRELAFDLKRHVAHLCGLDNNERLDRLAYIMIF